jgi:ribose transport system substrate-binding protein
VAGVGLSCIAVAACGSSASSSSTSSGSGGSGGSSSSSGSSGSTGKKFVLGVSNTLVGNGFREEMICAAKAEAKASGRVSKVIVDSANTSAAGQVAQIRDLISAGANAIVMNPADPNALNNVIQQGAAQGVVMVTADQGVTSPVAYTAHNNQYQYGYIGMKWLAQQLHGHGNVVELRGAAGAPADDQRHQGVLAALKQYPGVHLVKSVFTGWEYAPAASDMLAILNSGIKVDGVWTSGIDYTVVNAFKTAGKPYVPVVGTDGNGFIHQLLTLSKQGLTGAVVTNPAVIGGVAAHVAIEKLTGGNPPKVTEIQPQLITYKQTGELQKLYRQGVAPDESDVTEVPPYTNYTPAQLAACQA